MSEDIVPTMINQHKTLVEEISLVLSLSEKNNFNPEKIIQGLKKFTKDLSEHLELENQVFYKGLLKKMRAKGQDTSKTERFIMEMEEIERGVKKFLGEYKTVKNVVDRRSNFKRELTDLTELLKLRIESEESGVYLYWKMF